VDDNFLKMLLCTETQPEVPKPNPEARDLWGSLPAEEESKASHQWGSLYQAKKMYNKITH
jgi:hypothetical protein